MRYFLRLCIIATVAISTPTWAKDLTLWQNLSYGMTRDEVNAAQPTVVSTPGTDRLGNGASCDLRLTRYRAGTDDFVVCFYFLNDRLHQVTMTFVGKPFRGDFDEVVTLLSARYGQPLGVKPTSLVMDADWLLPNETNISVFLMTELTPLMNIVYQRRLADEATRF